MADKSIEQLNAAEKVYLSDLFVLQQSGTAKKLTGQVLKNWLLELAQGHGGITSIDLQSTSGLNKTYRITLADDTYFDMTVADGKGITSVAKTSTAGLVDTYTMKFNAGSDFVFTVKNGEKGDKGDVDRLYFKFASQKPADASHDMGDIPDEWLGFYAGTTAPTGWQDYTWVRIKGDKGDKGDAARLTSHSTTYMVSDSGTIVPSGSWVSNVPNVPQGKYLWTRTVLTFNTGDPVTSYSVSRFGIDGSGAVSSVNGKNPDSTGNVSVNAEDITTTTGTSIEAALAQKQEQITASGLLKGTGNGGVAQAKAGADYQAPITAGAGVRISGSKVSTAAAPRNLLDNSDFRNPVAQAGVYGLHGTKRYVCDRWMSEGIEAATQTAAGLRFNASFGYIAQKIEKMSGKTVTVAYKTSRTSSVDINIYDSTVSKKLIGKTSTPVDGVAIATFQIPSANDTVALVLYPGDGSTISWVAMYEGLYTADTLPEYQPKGYGVELNECKRYFEKIGSDTWTYGGYPNGSGKVIVELPVKHPMRVTPSCAGTCRVFGNNGWTENLAPNVGDTITGYTLNLDVDTNNMTPGYVYIVTGTVDLISDL